MSPTIRRRVRGRKRGVAGAWAGQVGHRGDVGRGRGAYLLHSLSFAQRQTATYGRAAPTKVDAYQPVSIGIFSTSSPVCGASMM